MAFNTGDPLAIPPSHFGLSNISELGPSLGWIRNSLWLALNVSVLATLAGGLLAWIVARTDVPGRSTLTLLIILPYPMGSMVAAAAWAILGAKQNGLMNVALSELFRHHVTLVNAYSVPGIVMVEALVATPVCFLLIESALRNMDSTLEESASVLGSGPISTTARITLPLMLPSVLGALLFTFISSMSAFAVPSILGHSLSFHVATQQVYLLYNSFTPKYPQAAMIGVALVLISTVLVILVNRVLRRRTYAVIGGKGRPGKRVKLGRWKPAALLVVYGYIFLGVVLPLAALITAALQATNNTSITHPRWTLHNFSYVLGTYPMTQKAISNSLILGVGTGVIGVLLATAVAVSVDRGRRAGRRGRGGRVMEILTMAPQAIPGLIFGLAMLWLILSLPFHLYGSVWSILIAFLVLFLPLAYRTVAGVVSQADSSLTEAARTLGASRATATRTIAIPLLRSGMVAAAVLLFMLSMSEVGAAVMLSGPDSPVLGPTLFNFYDSGGISLVSALAVVQVAVVGVAITIVRKVSGRWLNL
ncbi:MAG TPA: iron ABC transporter permease [Jatrophihabitans sp.]